MFNQNDALLIYQVLDLVKVAYFYGLLIMSPPVVRIARSLLSNPVFDYTPIGHRMALWGSVLSICNGPRLCTRRVSSFRGFLAVRFNTCSIMLLICGIVSASFASSFDEEYLLGTHILHHTV